MNDCLQDVAIGRVVTIAGTRWEVPVRRARKCNRFTVPSHFPYFALELWAMKRRQGPRDPLQLELACGLDRHDVLNLHQHSRADEDLPWLGFIAEARGHVRYHPDGGIVEAPLIANRAERSEAVRNANAETVPEAAPG